MLSLYAIGAWPTPQSVCYNTFIFLDKGGNRDYGY